MSNYSLFIHVVYPLIFSLSRDVVQIKHFQIDRFISTGWINTDLMTSSTEQAETIASDTSAMDTSADVVPATIEEKPVNGAEEEDSKVGKRKRSTKKPTEPEANNVSVTNERPKRNLSKRKWHSSNYRFDLNMHYR